MDFISVKDQLPKFEEKVIGYRKWSMESGWPSDYYGEFDLVVTVSLLESNKNENTWEVHDENYTHKKVKDVAFWMPYPKL